MLVKIFGTVFSKTFASVANFLIVILTAKYLGAAARGEIALVVLSVSIVVLFQAIIGGSALTFFAARHALRQLLMIAMSWTFALGIIVSVVLGYFELIQPDLLMELLLISIPQGIVLIFQSILIGRKRIMEYNMLEFTRSATLVGTISLVLLGFGKEDLSWIYAAYSTANIASVGLGIYFMWQLPKVTPTNSIVELSKKLFRFGIQVQLNNIAQMFNYRFVYFVIEKWKGLEVLGVFSVAISIAETVWIISKSIATYQTSLLVNTKDQIKQALNTVAFAKMSVAFTFVALGALLLVPEGFFVWVFGEEFVSISQINLYFAPAIMFLSFFGIINHYFYSTDQNQINIYAALVGNVLTLIFALLLIKDYSLEGAALTYSIAYFGMLIFLLAIFVKNSGIGLAAFAPSKSDFYKFKSLLLKGK
jgi:O-antigen/teichoic acid export membrane protein